MYCWYLLLFAVLVLSHPSTSERFHGRQCSERFCEDLPDARLFRSLKNEANHKRYISRDPDIRGSRQKSTRDSVTVRRSPEVDLLKFRGDAKKFEDERFDGQLRRSRYDADNYDRYASRDYEIVRRELIKDTIEKNNNRRETYTRALVSNNAKQRFSNERSATASRDSRKPIRDGNAMFEGTEENGNIHISSLRTGNDMNNLESRRVKEESERRQVRSQLEFIRQRNTEAELRYRRGNNNRERTNIRDINAVRPAGADENHSVKGLRNSLDRTTDLDRNDNRRIKQNRRLRQTSDVIDSSSERRQIHALRYQNERVNPNSAIRNDFDDKARDRRPNVMRIRTVTIIRENTQARILNNLRTGDFLFRVPTVRSDATSVRERRQFRSSPEPVALRRISYPFSALQQVTFANRISAGHSEGTPQTRTLRELSRHTNKNYWDIRSDSDRTNIRRDSRASYYRKEQRNTERYFSGPTVENNGLRSTEYKVRSDSILRLPTELYESVMNLNRRNVRDISKRDISQRSERQFSRTSVLSTETRHLFANMQRRDSTRALSRFSSERRSLRTDLIRLNDKRRSSHLVNTRFERITRICTDRYNDRSIDSRISRTPSDVTRQVSTERQPSIVQMERSDLHRNRGTASRDLSKLGQRYEIRPVNSGLNLRLLAKDQSPNRQLTDSVDRVDVRRSINHKDNRFTITRRDTQLNDKRQHLLPTVRAFAIQRSVRKDSKGNTDTATKVTRLSRRMDYHDINIRRQKQHENTQTIREVFERKHSGELNSDLILERLNRRSYERENSRLLKQRLITRSFDLQRINAPRYDIGYRQVRPTTQRTDDLHRINRDVSQRGLEFRQLNFRFDAELIGIRDNAGRDRSQKVSTRTYRNKQEISHENRLSGLATERQEARRMDQRDIKPIRVVRLDSRTSDVRTEGANIRENILRNANRITEIRSHRQNMDRRFDRDLRHDAEMSEPKTERKDIRLSVVRKLSNGDVTPTENRVSLTSAIRRDFDKRIMDHDQYESITDNVLSWKYLILLVQGIYICGILLQIGAGDSSSKFNGRYLALWTPTYHVKLN